MDERRAHLRARAAAEVGENVAVGLRGAARVGAAVQEEHRHESGRADEFCPRVGSVKHRFSREIAPDRESARVDHL